MSKKPILVTLNQTGIDLTEDEIDSVLNLNDKSADLKREYLSGHFNVEKDKLSRQMLNRYIQADKVMTRISAGSAEDGIRKRLSDTLLSTKRCYSHAEYRACIELCALFSEMLANYLCIADKEILTNATSKMTPKDQNKINKIGTSEKYFTDKYNQRFRLRWLVKADILTPEDEARLLSVHDLRVKYFHHWNTDPDRAEADALDALAKVSTIASKYLEVLGTPPDKFNQANMDRIRRYMEAVEEEKK